MMSRYAAEEPLATEVASSVMRLGCGSGRGGERPSPVRRSHAIYRVVLSGRDMRTTLDQRAWYERA